MKQYRPTKTSPYALWWFVKNSPNYGYIAMPKYLFILMILNNGGTLINTQKRPLIILPSNIDIYKMDKPKLFNFQAKRQYYKMLKQLPIGLNH